MERVAAVQAEARDVGLEVHAEADRLIVRGSPVHEHLARRLLEEKPAVLAVLAHEDEEVRWRIEAMRPQVPFRGPIPVLMARHGLHPAMSCISCGALLVGAAKYRCAPCARAAWLVLYEIREGVGSDD